MKHPILLFSAWALCLSLPAGLANAQSPFNTSAAGSSPFGRVYTPPANSQPALLPNPAGAPVAGSYNPGGVNPGYPAPAYSSEPIEPDHKLNQGDQLSFRVVEDRDSKPPETLLVTPSGEVNIPLIGPIPAAGKSVAQFTSEVKARLEREYYYHATVVMGLNSVAQRPSRGRVYISGAVHAQGPQELPLDEPLTVSKAVIKAGGPLDFSDLTKVKVLRKGNTGKPLIVNVKQILKGNPAGDIALQAGDTIVVPEAWIKF